jgi:methyl-accepting chemotaxis protein
VGTILDWTDRSAEVAAEEDVTALVEAASRGDFSRRVDVARREGFFRTLGEHMNRLVDTTDRSLHEINDAVNRVAQGDLTREFEALTAAADQVSSTSQSLSQSASEQAASVEQTTASPAGDGGVGQAELGQRQCDRRHGHEGRQGGTRKAARRWARRWKR